MKRLTALILSFCLAINSFAKENYLEYYKAINHCEELFLFKGDIAGALAEYKTVFEKYKKPFAKDCFIAAQLACYTDDRRYAECFITKAFERGLELDGLKESPTINKFLSVNKELANKLESVYPAKHKQFTSKINAELRASIINMKNIDDSAKQAFNGMPMGEESQKRRVAYTDVLTNNTSQLVQLIQKNGFPGDNMIGFMNYGFTGDQQRREYCYTLRSLVDQLFAHDCCCFFMAEDQLKAAVEQGEILPAMYAMIYEWAHKNMNESKPEAAFCSKQSTPQTEYYNVCTVIPPWNRSKDTALVNKCRERIGIASLEHTAKKRDYEKATGMRLFFGMFDIY